MGRAKGGVEATLGTKLDKSCNLRTPPPQRKKLREKTKDVAGGLTRP